VPSRLKVRNIGLRPTLTGTTTTERIPFYSGIVHKIGEVHGSQQPTGWNKSGSEDHTAAATQVGKIIKSTLLIRGHVDLIEANVRVDGALFLPCRQPPDG